MLLVCVASALLVADRAARRWWNVRPYPLRRVQLIPASLGVAPSHVTHAETLVDNGIAAFVLDNFGGRNVTSTVANQTQFSFAASAYDVLAALKILAARPTVDAIASGLFATCARMSPGGKHLV